MPGTNSFISEFLVLIGTFTVYPAWATVATFGIVLAAVYMLWVFQRTMTGPVRGVGVLGGAHRGDDDFGGFGVGGGQPGELAPVGAPVPATGAHASAGSVLQPEGQGPTGNSTGEAHPAGSQQAPSKIRAKFGDLTAREVAVVTPLVALIILLGVYPQPVLDVINPTAERTMTDVGFTDPPPAVDGPSEGGR
jgi:NADH-quinone oxidoreductase subunit M